MAETIAFLTARGIPVLAHIGLTPQSVNAFGGFRVQGRGDAHAAAIRADAQAVEQAGAFGIVIEGVPEPLARTITEETTIPTIGIGASPACDGQVLGHRRHGWHVRHLHTEIRQTLCGTRRTARGCRRTLRGRSPGTHFPPVLSIVFDADPAPGKGN